MHVIFVHGWSVTDTDTYGDLPRWLEQQAPDFEIQNVYLGKYVSFVDTVTVDDIARALQQALIDALGPKMSDGFACITHSTGGPAVRLWVKLYHEGRLTGCPMKHLVMLAPANHGSALAQLGKGTFSRFKSLLEGVEPGVRVLDWLELGSEESWRLNESWLDYDCVGAGMYPFVLTGQSIDRAFYDHLNSYTGEAGSDGVVRACAANLNYALARLHQEGDALPVDTWKRRPRTAFGVLPGLSHSGEKMGIIRSVALDGAARHPTAKWVLRCLRVRSGKEYDALCDELDALTAETQKEERIEEQKKRFFGTRTYRTSRYTMLVLRFVDDRGEALRDYDLYLTGGPSYDPDNLPPGFFVDRQRNRRDPGRLTYYLDHDALRRGLNKAKMEGRIGFRLDVRPGPGGEALAFYERLEYRSDEDGLSDILRPNETLMVEFKVQRKVDATVFRIEPDLKPSRISAKPSGKIVP
jgi:hypothetical protein